MVNSCLINFHVLPFDSHSPLELWFQLHGMVGLHCGQPWLCHLLLLLLLTQQYMLSMQLDVVGQARLHYRMALLYNLMVLQQQFNGCQDDLH
jgi:hypothetical protein